MFVCGTKEMTVAHAYGTRRLLTSQNNGTRPHVIRSTHPCLVRKRQSSDLTSSVSPLTPLLSDEAEEQSRFTRKVSIDARSILVPVADYWNSLLIE
jgi:hypothetical protein